MFTKIIIIILIIGLWLVTLLIAYINGLAKGYTNLVKLKTDFQPLEVDVLEKTIQRNTEENDIIINEVAKQKIDKYRKNKKKSTNKSSKKGKN